MKRNPIIKTLRGLILQGLDLEYPQALSDIAVLALLQGGGHAVGLYQVRRHLEYLSGPGKEYLELNKARRDYWQARLTPKGKDLLMGVIGEDPGVYLVR